jgi:hypothetical protein
VIAVAVAAMPAILGAVYCGHVTPAELALDLIAVSLETNRRR